MSLTSLGNLLVSKILRLTPKKMEALKLSCLSISK